MISSSSSSRVPHGEYWLVCDFYLKLHWFNLHFLKTLPINQKRSHLFRAPSCNRCLATTDWPLPGWGGRRPCRMERGRLPWRLVAVAPPAAELWTEFGFSDFLRIQFILFCQFTFKEEAFALNYTFVCNIPLFMIQFLSFHLCYKLWHICYANLACTSLVLAVGSQGSTHIRCYRWRRCNSSWDR